MTATIEDAAADGDVVMSARPHLVRLVDHQVAQQVRENLVTRRRLRGIGPSAAIPICRISRCIRLRLMVIPSPRSIAASRREQTAKP